MSWSRGSFIFDAIIEAVQSHVKENRVRQNIYEDLVGAFVDADCDTLDECTGTDKAFDNVWKAYKRDHPEDFDPEEWNEDVE